MIVHLRVSHVFPLPWPRMKRHSVYCLQDEFEGAEGSVVAADFYRAGVLLPLSDAEIVARVLRNLQFCEPGFLGAQARALPIMLSDGALTARLPSKLLFSQPCSGRTLPAGLHGCYHLAYQLGSFCEGDAEHCWNG